MNGQISATTGPLLAYTPCACRKSLPALAGISLRSLECCRGLASTSNLQAIILSWELLHNLQDLQLWLLRRT